MSSPDGLRSRILVTGATGFVGRHICDELLRAGYRVTALVRPGRPERLPSGVEANAVQDITDVSAIQRAAEGCVAAVHLAGRAHVITRTAGESISLYRRVNVEGTGVVADACRSAGVRTLVVLSSIAARAFDSLDVLSRSSLGFTDPYGLSKKESEEVLLRSAPERTAILRPPGIYGPGMKGNIPRLVRLIDSGVPIPVPRFRNARPLLYVKTLADAVHSLVRNAQPGLELFELADEEVLSSRELVGRIAESLGKEPRLVSVAEGPMRAAGRVGDFLSRWLGVPVNSRSVDLLFGSLAIDSHPFRAKYATQAPIDPAQRWRETVAWLRASSVIGL